MAPDISSIGNAVGASRVVALPVRWQQLAESINRGEPLSLGALRSDDGSDSGSGTSAGDLGACRQQ